MHRPGSPGYLAEQRADLLRFMVGARHPLGFGWLDEAGRLDGSHPVELWITCRMTHVAALGLLAGEPPADGGPDAGTLADLVAHGVAALTGALHDEEHGGWFAAVGPEGPVDDRKQAYGHAFVVLAASSAAAAGAVGAQELLDEALATSLARFWDESAGLSVEEWDRAWTTLDTYRGVNANMHTVEAYLAAGDVTGDASWHARAGRIAAQVVAWASANDWRIPEHFDARWTPVLEHHHDQPAHPFRPYGATVGHGLEWARLLLAVDLTLGADAPAGLRDAAVALFDRAVADGWAADGADGFVYTTDWSGVPVVRERMHWVAAEAVNTARALADVTGRTGYSAQETSWWAYIDTHLVDRGRGSWHHELDPQNRPSATVWPGKPDVYHAYQAALLPTVPLVPSFAAALASRAGHRAGPATDQVDHVVVMGVSGAGKSTVARAVADRLGWAYAEGDDLHPAANVAKMTAGVPLTDEDRWPWLASIRAMLSEHDGAGRASVTTCSALRRVYRDALRAGPGRVRFVHVSAPAAELEQRLTTRAGHFMPTSLLTSQLETLEPLGDDEDGVTVDGTAEPAAVVGEVLRALGLGGDRAR